ncbi:hypothetical protein ADICYQ_5362 [Cyclobacterium qasimii M12-11B]|uniref:Uncharacterized protein n=1 Tax=Cyclobacterium qasimii M12-11B TaxID=641524 RepID=S7V648_9BACT|nr:hypothetical protein ADICYQ_5362 [Cyclobacterium qasimii M12-11B]
MFPIEIKPSRFHSPNFNIRLMINKTWKVSGFNVIINN